MQLKLVDVYSEPLAIMVLWDLLKEREPHQCISHQVMPTWWQHFDFVKSQPYKAWYLIEANNVYVGATYLTHNDEIGIFLFAKRQDKGIGRVAVQQLLKLHPSSRYLANVSPRNGPSVAFFENLGFKHIQNTYELVNDCR